jgi:hypothetical protein
MSSRPSLYRPLQTILPMSLLSLILTPLTMLPPSTLTTTHIPTPLRTMMIETSQPRLQCPLLHPRLPVPLPPGSSPSLATLPSILTYAKYTPKMSMAYGAKHETPKDKSSTASRTLPNWNISFIRCASMTLMHGSSRKHG